MFAHIGLFLFLAHIGLFLFLAHIGLFLFLAHIGLFLAHIGLFLFLAHIGLFLFLAHIGLDAAFLQSHFLMEGTIVLHHDHIYILYVCVYVKVKRNGVLFVLCLCETDDE